jgi:DNA-binding SARP family transcriptional activator/tetratricopeptide (TPR) repeat protein
MRFRVLGPLAVWDGHGWVSVPAGKQRVLLAVLLLKANQLVAAGWLIEQLWAQRLPAGAANQLQVYISRLRRRLDDRPGLVLLTQSPGYRLVVGADELDLHRFEELVAGGRRAMRDGALERAASSLGEALELWQGRALADVPSAPLVDDEATRLEERRLLAVEDLADVELRRGRHGGLVGQLQALVAEQPLRERLWGQLLVALYRSGRQAEALAAYQQLRGRLVGELGIEPCADLQRLQRLILAADPVLEAAPQGASGPAGAAGHAAIGEPWPTPTPMPVPRQLPPDAAAFTGREPELTLVDKVLGTAGPARPAVILAIDGAGGIGKSALAVHAAHRLAAAGQFPDGQLYVDLQGASDQLAPLAPLEVLGRFLRSLGTAPAAIPGEPEEAAARFRSLAAQRRLLVVLDNARDAGQVAPLLPGAPGCGVLVTSRRLLASLDGGHHLHLDVLSPEEAMVLLGRLAGHERMAAEPAAAAEVARWCGYLPLALRIAGARLAARPGWTVRTLADRLADARCRLDELELADRGVRASFAVSYQQLSDSADPLDRQAAAAFPLLGLLDSPDVGVAVVARLLDGSVAATERVLERLVDARLLETSTPGRYRLHDLLRLYARESVVPQHPESDQAAALGRAFGFYVSTVWHTWTVVSPSDHRLARADARWAQGGLEFSDATAALDWLEAERTNLVAAVRQAATIPGLDAAAVQLALGLFAFLLLRNYWQDLMEVDHAALGVARRLGDRACQALAHTDLGAAYGRQGRYAQAANSLCDGLAIFRELGDRPGQAVSLNNLGCVNDLQGRYDQALACLQESLSIRRELDDRCGQGICLSNLGDVYRRQGRYDQALARLQQGLAISRELGGRQCEANSLNNLGLVHQAQGRYEQALACLQQSLAIGQELGDRRVQTDSLLYLGRLYQRQGRYDEALANLRESLVIQQELHDPFGEAESLQELGVTMQRLGRHEDAQAHWRQALTILERLQTFAADEVRALVADQSAPSQH